jgi:kojibiose phosphorylase
MNSRIPFVFPGLSEQAWCVTADAFRCDRVAAEETMFTLANGHHGVRGSLEFARHLGKPGSFFAGCYDRTPIYFEELVNTPAWVDLTIQTDGLFLDPAGVEVREYRRTLDLRQGLLHTALAWVDAKGRRTRYESFRLVHRQRRHWALLWGRVTPENWSGELLLAGGIDARIANVQTQSQVQVQHLEVTRLAADDLGVVYEGRTLTSKLPVAVRTRLTVSNGAGRHLRHGDQSLQEVWCVPAVKGRPVTFCKSVAAVALLHAGADAGPVARRELRALLRAGQPRALAAQQRAWQTRWKRADVVIGGHVGDQAAVRFNIFHLLSLDPEEDLDVAIGAKGLHGEGYRGHFFWDTEIFMLPFYLATRPATARNLLLYRCRRLAGARRHAADWGHRGARFPWESCTTGGDVSPTKPRDILAGQIGGQPVEHFQVHITADIAYAVARYREAAGDDEFFREHGAQLLIETAQFWASRVGWDSARQRYVIRDVQCVDEFHTHVDNNAYTNYMAAENLRLAGAAVAELRRREPALLRRLCRATGLTGKDVRTWAKIRDGLALPFDPATGLVEQFDGYFALTPVKVGFDANGWPFLPPEFWNGPWRKSQVIKQADVVLATYQLPDAFSDAAKRANLRFYEERDEHSSSLSPSTYAILGVEVGEVERAYRSFRVSAYRDMLFRKNNDGIHAACLGGTWQACVNGFGGLRVRADGLHFRPRLPRAWNRLAYAVAWQGRRIAVEIAPATVSVRLTAGKPLAATIHGRPVLLTRRTVNVPLPS